MTKRWLSAIAILVLVGAAALFSQGMGLAAGPWYVSTTGNDSNSCLAPASACLTIQAAVNKASAGDTVNVAAGTYPEQVVIAKGLTLQGAGDTTIIRPSTAQLTALYTYPAGTFWPGTVMGSIVLVQNTGAANVSIKNLKVDGVNVTLLPAGAARLAGILYGESSGLVSNVTVATVKTSSNGNGYQDRTYGIDLSATTGPVKTVEVSTSRIIDFARNGIQSQGAMLSSNLHHNQITGPGTITPQLPNGILFIQGTGGNASDNTIQRLHHNATSARAGGILLYGSLTPGLIIERNDISDTDDGVILSAGANDVIVRLNTLHDNLEVGVHLEDGATNNAITTNNFMKNKIAGIRFAGATDPTFPDTPPGTGNTAHQNNFCVNGFGVVDYDTQVFDATNNWWGASNGPGPVGPGSGDKVTANVTFSPFLSAPVTPTTCAQLEVKKVLVPAADIGRFNLRIDNVTRASNVGDGGTTGKIPVVAGNHTFAETAAGNNQLALYATSVVCKNGLTTLPTTGSGAGPYTVSVPANGADVVCTITNTSDVPAACNRMRPFDKIQYGTSGPNTLTGTSGRDFIDGLGGIDTITGKAGDDCLLGGEGNDNIDADSGNDYLDGGPGTGDTLTGDSGTDVCVNGETLFTCP